MKPVRATVRLLDWLFLSPFRLYLSIRRQMTGASVTLLVVGITTVNIIWGYPWNGMFAACFALLLVGWLINRIARPNLSVDFSLPNSTPAEQPFSLVMHATNQGRLPAMDLRIDYAKPSGSRRRRRKRGKTLYDSLTPAHAVSLIYPSERTSLDSQLVFNRRGIYRVPDVVVISLFPFHLFRSIRRLSTEASVAVTPRLMTGEEDDVSRKLLNTLGGWSHRLLSGDALDYTGSREYETGMPVRRWDFTSWARLGKPIVREFQSPSIQIVMLVVDMCQDSSSESDQDDQEPTIEKLLSFAATAVTELTRKMVLVRLVVTSEVATQATFSTGSVVLGDTETLLIRLAGAKCVSAVRSDQNIRQVFEHVGHAPVLLLTTRSESDLPVAHSSRLTTIRVDAKHDVEANHDPGFGSRVPLEPREGDVRSRSDVNTGTVHV